MTPSGAGALALIAVLTLGACGTTYIDTSVTIGPTVPATTLAAVDPDAPIDELLSEIGRLAEHLDEQIVDAEAPAGTLARIEELWAAAEPQLRGEDPDQLFPFQQGLELFRTGVTRNRPADASKGFKLWTAAVADRSA